MLSQNQLFVLFPILADHNPYISFKFIKKVALLNFLAPLQASRAGLLRHFVLIFLNCLDTLGFIYAFVLASHGCFTIFDCVLCARFLLVQLKHISRFGLTVFFNVSFN